jgi:FkbM family methyltransferase
VALRNLLAGLSSLPWFRDLYKIVKPLPILGLMARGLRPLVLPGGFRVWMQVPSGSGKGLWLNLDPFYEEPYLDGEYELPIQKLLAKYLPRGSTFYDIGGHIGFISMIAARLVGKEGRVFSFEPDPENATKTQEHVKRNLLGQVEVVPFAVWSQCGHVVFSLPPRSSGRAVGKVVPTSSLHTRDTEIEVQAITLDSFAHDHPVPDLIKIDVEGAEAQVLEGAGEVFDCAKPTLIVEVHHQQAEAQVVGWLREKGYALEWLTQESGFPRHLLARPNGAD